MIFEFHPAARDELVANVDYYNGILQGLGAQYRDAVKAALAQLEHYPLSGRPISRGSRRLVVSGFPYDLVYEVSGDVLRILAIAHHRRRPGYWRNRTER